jgi:hypothetical protein
VSGILVVVLSSLRFNEITFCCLFTESDIVSTLTQQCRFPIDIELAGIKEKLEAGMISEAKPRHASPKVRENRSLLDVDGRRHRDVAATGAISGASHWLH